jgi:hypothetical protein
MREGQEAKAVHHFLPIQRDMTLLTPSRRRGRRFLLPVLAALILLTSLTAAAPASAAPGMEVAIQDDAVLVGRLYYDRDRALDQIQQLGATRIRVNLTWTQVLGARQSGRRFQPSSLVYHWEKYDALVDAARARGLKVHMTITGAAPRWATRNKRVGVYWPDSGKFGAFTRSAATHFLGRVDRYSIWNEPNYKGWLQPMKKAPRIYRALFRAGWRGIKSRDPNVQVLIGETAPYAIKGRAMAPIAFLRGVTCTDRRWRKHCAGIKADGYAHHPYEFKNKPEASYPGADNVTIGTLPRLTKALDRLWHSKALQTSYGGPLPVHLTEFGYMATGKRRLPVGRRAAYLRRAFQIARRNPRVQSMLQYLLVAPPPQWAHFNTAITLKNGTPTAPFHALQKFSGR